MKSTPMTPGTITGDGRTYLLDQALISEDLVCIDITDEQPTRIHSATQRTLAEFIAEELGRDTIRIRFPIPQESSEYETVAVGVSETTWSSRTYRVQLAASKHPIRGLLEVIAWCFTGESREIILCAAADIRRDARAMREAGHSRVYVAAVRGLRIATALGPVVLDSARRTGRRIATIIKAWTWFA